MRAGEASPSLQTSTRHWIDSNQFESTTSARRPIWAPRFILDLHGAKDARLRLSWCAKSQRSELLVADGSAKLEARNEMQQAIEAARLSQVKKGDSLLGWLVIWRSPSTTTSTTTSTSRYKMEESRDMRDFNQ